MVFTEFVGTVISVVLAVVSETEVGLGVVLELVELRGSSPARGIVDVVFVVVEAVVVQVILFQKLSFFHQQEPKILQQVLGKGQIMPE